MSHLITAGAVTITPTAITDFRARRVARSNVHDITGRGNPDVTLRPSSLRTGSFTLTFTNTADAIAAEAAHAAGVVFTLTSDVVGVAMSYIVPEGGGTDIAQDVTLAAWTLVVDFQEVTL